MHTPPTPQHTSPTDKPTVVLNVAIASPLRRVFDYLPSAETNQEQLTPGARLSVPFGHQRQVMGILISISSHSTTATQRLRPIHSVIDNIGLDQHILKLCQWCANYYHYPLGEVCHLALPTLLRKPIAVPEKPPEMIWQLTEKGRHYDENDFGRAHKQREAWQLAKNHQYLQTDTLKTHGVQKAIINSLIDKQLLQVTTAEKLANIRDTNKTSGQPTREPKQHIDNALDLAQIIAQAPQHQPNQEQIDALKHINTDTFTPYLLEGVTGSGKTEVYLQAITQVLAKGQQALVLVPEIGLTPQTVQRFEQRFSTRVATLHSGMSDKQRLATWLDAKAGSVSIIIGTRSAIFTPLPQLGLLIVDEEHDLSYKQQEGVRYSARDVAIIRAQQQGIPIILGSATPSLESLHNVQKQRFTHLTLTQRATAVSLPEIKCVHQQGDHLSPDSLKAIEKTLNNQQQVLIFINRRGYAPTLICQQCGWMSQCKACDSRMTIHHFQQVKQHLHCHHCDTKSAVPEQCQHCHSTQLNPLGQGTQRSQEELSQHFPDTPILRIDRDSMSKKGQLASALETINSEQPCILVGTQMLAKGHHFTKVSLVVVLGLDNSFFSSDFRGPERMAQLLIQVAGRAGRETDQGTVLLQTQFGDHPHLQCLIHSGYHSLAKQLLAERQFSAMPPYQHMAFVRCHAQQPFIAQQFLQKVKYHAQKITPASPQLQYLGPLAAIMEKRNNRYYYQLQIKANHRRELHYVLSQLCQQLEKEKVPKGLHWLVDVDPQEA